MKKIWKKYEKTMKNMRVMLPPQTPPKVWKKYGTNMKIIRVSPYATGVRAAFAPGRGCRAWAAPAGGPEPRLGLALRPRTWPWAWPGALARGPGPGLAWVRPRPGAAHAGGMMCGGVPPMFVKGCSMCRIGDKLFTIC